MIAIYVITAVCCLITGGCAGIVGYDLVNRKRLLERLHKAESEMKDAQASLAELHNKSTAALKSLTDRVNEHDVAMRATVSADKSLKARRF